MVHAYGVLSADGGLTAADLEDWPMFEVRDRYVGDAVGIAATTHGDLAADRRARAADGRVHCWVIGDVYGFDDRELGGAKGYEPRPHDHSAVRYCARLYDRYGIDFVRGLNGSFTIGIYDRVARRFALCTDRFGTVPVYHARPDDDTLVFSTNVQDLPYHPAVRTSFHPGYLHEYLAFRRTFGVKTPFTGIEELQPGTITTIDLADGSVTTERYWTLAYRPRRASFEWFVDEFTRRFRAVIDEWTRDGGEYGVLLSGGSDSRLVLAALEEPTAFHMNDWMNREARAAERVAFAADAEFVMLRREPEYHVEALERNRRHANFNGWFTQPYTSGFDDEITERVDGLLSGLYGDTLFKGFGVPSPTVSLGPLGSTTLPVERAVETIDDYVDLLLERAHDELDTSTDLREVLESNIYRDGNRIVSHGVAYESIDELVYYGDCYPLSNDDDMVFHVGLQRLLPYRSPFLDNRLVDLSVSYPVRYRLRKNLVNRAVDRIAPDLAAIPHGESGMPLSRPFAVDFLGLNLKAFWRKHVSDETPPKSYLTNGPWVDDPELLRAHDFLGDSFGTILDRADALPGVDADTFREQYRAHHRGENRIVELFTLMTVLTMPATEQVLSEAASSAARTAEARTSDARIATEEVTDVA